MMTIAGQDFLTDFQTQQLITQFEQKTHLKVAQISTQQVYVLSRALEGDDYKKALDLLAVDKADALNNLQSNQLQVIVAPRFGTISPWASKATDIFNNCEIKINRVERVIVYTLTMDGDVSEKLPKAAEQLLFDRMTQSLVYDLSEVNKLFDDQAPAALNHIDIIGVQFNLIDPVTLEVTMDKAHTLNELFQLLQAQGIQVRSMRNKSNRLEELFVKMVEKNLEGDAQWILINSVLRSLP